MSPRIVPSDRAQPDPRLLGGKASKLAELSQAGLPVPAWLVVTTEAFDAAGLAKDDAEALLAAFDDRFPEGAFVAVRSSAVDEDSAQDSFAGQLDTHLYVTRATLLDRVRDVFASASQESVMAYRRARGLGDAPARAAVVVQRMVDARAAGVLFTANPTSGERGEAVVSAGLGLGEGVVADLVETDTFTLTLATGEVRGRRVVEKTSRIVIDAERGGGTRREEVPAAEGALPCLSDPQLAELCALAREVEALFEQPQDIEWALDADGGLHLLQARPITTLDREQIFDNSNIVESYPGLCSPLTYSFARRCYEETFRESSRQWGVPEHVLREHRSVHEDLLGLIQGRIYYNILNWYELFLFVPGFEGLLPAWEKALGLPPRFVQRRGDGRTVDKAWALWRAARRFTSLTRDVEAFQARFAEARRDFEQRDLGRLSAHELFDLYQEIAGMFLQPYAVSLANDTFAQQLYDQLGKLIDRWDLGDPNGLRNDLLCGESGMESVEPVRSILRLAGRIRADAELCALFASDADPAEVHARITSVQHPELAAEVAEHVRLYGDRTLHELKLETPSASEDPTFLIAMLRNYLRGGQDVDAMEAREREIREGAEATVEAALAGQPVRRRTFRWVLERTRATVKYRENLRLSRTRCCGMVKKVFRALGRRFTDLGLIDAPDDVFWLTIEELGHQLRGHAVNHDLRALATLRREDYARYAEQPAPPPRIVTQGPVYARRFTPHTPNDVGDGELSGIGCSPGRVRARAKVILDPHADMTVDGEILVAPMTDPGWVFLMVAAGGLVVERGSVLSHTAIIGRELGIPTVVAVPDATRRIQDGDLVEIDGQSGMVRIVEPAPQSSD